MWFNGLATKQRKRTYPKTNMKELFLTVLLGSLISVASNVQAEDLPEGVTVKNRQIKNPVMTTSVKDYYRDNKLFFSDELSEIKGAPNKKRTFTVHDGANTILIVSGDRDSVHYAGKKNYRIWVDKQHIQVVDFDGGFFVYISFDQGGNPVFQSDKEHAEMRKFYMDNKDKYQLMEAPTPK